MKWNNDIIQFWNYFCILDLFKKLRFDKSTLREVIFANFFSKIFRCFARRNFRESAFHRFFAGRNFHEFVELSFCELVSWPILEGHSNKKLVSVQFFNIYLILIFIHFIFTSFSKHNDISGVWKKLIHKPDIFHLFFARRNFRELYF